MRTLNGARVALLEARMSSELANLVRRHGGTPYCVAAVREAPLACGAQETAFIEKLAAEAFSVAVFLTGVGVTALFREAERIGRLPELLATLKQMTIVCRGPKPSAVLRRHGVPIALCAREPFTTPELLEAIDELDLTGKDVALVHYGDRSGALATALRDRGARLAELCLYEWQLPEDCSALRRLVQEIIAGELDAVAFTSQIQARHLLHIAAELGRSDDLIQALNTRTVVASVGPTCADTLRELGMAPSVVPEHPKMGQLVIALAQYISSAERPSLAHR